MQLQLIPWLTQTKVITLKIQLHEVSTYIKRSSQRSFTTQKNHSLLSLSLIHTYIYTHTQSGIFTHILSQTYHTFSLFLSHTHSRTYKHTYTDTHTHTHSLTFTLFFILSLSFTHIFSHSPLLLADIEWCIVRFFNLAASFS